MSKSVTLGDGAINESGDRITVDYSNPPTIPGDPCHLASSTLRSGADPEGDRQHHSRHRAHHGRGAGPLAAIRAAGR
jgi:hypothetical protein